MNTDAQILLDDTIALLEERGLEARKLAMLKSCEATDLTDEALVVATRAGFVKKTLEESGELLGQCLSEAAFAPLAFVIELNREAAPQAEPATSTMTATDYVQVAQQVAAATPQPQTVTPAQVAPITDEERDARAARAAEQRRRANPLVEDANSVDSELTFATFVEGEENRIALQAAKAVADGGTSGFNPLFIYGRSGLGKTHLLKAIQNYVVVNDPTRLCVYKTAKEFLSDYMQALHQREDRSAADALERAYQDIDVLIIDDIQQLANAQRTIDFFFNVFNYLHDHGRQIVIAADRTPQELGAQLGFDERVTSRVGGGFQVGVEVPAFELKYSLIRTFLERMQADAAAEGHLAEARVTLDDEIVQYMAERAGSNVRTIKAFCLGCLYKAADRQAKGRGLSRNDVAAIAKERFPQNQRVISIDDVQEAVEGEYNISHQDLIGAKRNKELMEPRHVAIWLARALTDNTLADIGDRFGGRSHGTVKHSIKWVDDGMKQNRLFANRVQRLRDELLEG